MSEDTFDRKAQTRLPDGTIVERDWTASERYQLYARGWRDGAGLRPTRKDHLGLGPYNRGYGDGSKARDAACEAEALRIGFTVRIVRLASDGEPVDT